MSEPKPATSLNPGLLARKGAAIPAPDVRHTMVANLDKALVEAATGVAVKDADGEAAKPVVSTPAVENAEANTRQIKRRIGCNGRIAMTVRFSQEDHLNLRLLSAHLNRSSQDILLAAFRGYLESNGGATVQQASTFLGKPIG